MLKRLGLFLVIFFFVFCSFAFADFGDKATLGGQDSSGQYHWRVDSSGDFIPGTTAQNDIGDASHEVDAVYATDAVISDDLTVGGTATIADDTTIGSTTTHDLTVSGNIKFLTYLSAIGSGPSDVTTLPTTAANSQTTLYRVARVFLATRTLTFGNGYPGQLMFLVAEPLSDTGTLTIDVTTQFGWTSISMDTIGDTVTLLYVDDTLGWIVAAAQGVTINNI